MFINDKIRSIKKFIKKKEYKTMDDIETADAEEKVMVLYRKKQEKERKEKEKQIRLAKKSQSPPSNWSATAPFVAKSDLLGDMFGSGMGGFDAPQPKKNIKKKGGMFDF